MRRGTRTFLSVLAGFLVVAAGFPLGSPPAAVAQGSPDLVISQVYGGGGNSGATYTHDFIELFNRGTASVSLNGWSVQYASATGTSWAVTALSGTLQAGQYYLVQQAAGAGGTEALPTPDATGSTNMSATAGKVALASTTSALTGSCPTTGVVDFVGFGSTANCFEGTGPTPAPSNANAVLRGGNGCTDTDNNSADFSAAAPMPRNTSSRLNACATIVADPVINEFVANHVGTDTHEYIEVFGSPNTDYSAYTILQIEGDGDGAGQIDTHHPVGTTDENGIWYTGFLQNALENGTMTLLLVRGFTGELGDIDSNNDGNIDTTFWEAIVDDVAVSDGGAGDLTYSTTVLAPGFGGSSFTPGGASRIPNGVDTNSVDDWTLNDFDGEGIPGFSGTPEPGEALNTPGAINALVEVPPTGADVVISQVYGGGGNAGALYTHDFIELFNRSDEPVNLGGWSVQYASAAGSTWQVTVLSGTLEPGQYYLVQQAQGANPGTALPTPDAIGTIPMAAGAGKVALVNSSTALSGTCPEAGIVDFVGFGSTANCFEGSGPTPAPSNTASVVRLEAGCQDTDDNAADFVTANPPTPRNTSSPLNPCGDPGDPPTPSPVISCPVGVRTVETYATSGTVTGTISEGEIVSLEITNVTPPPAAGEFSLADVTGGSSASATLVVPDDISLGTITTAAQVVPFSVQISATSDEGQTGSCTASVDVIPLVPVGAVQGVIADGQTSFTSPLLNATIAVRAVVTQHTMESNGNRGFFLQNTPAEADGDPLSSDGIFVFNGGFTTLRADLDGPVFDQFGNNYPVTIGDELVVRGTVGQFFGMTQLAGSSAFVWDRTAEGLDVETAVEIAEIDPPNDFNDSIRYFRRHLGMQMEVPAGSLVVNGRDVFAGTDAEVWAIRGDHPVAQRANPYERRVFRDAHPLDNNPATNFDDGNGYRFVLGSFGLKGAQANQHAVLAPARTFDTITAANRGGVYLSFGKYTVNVIDQLSLLSGVDPAQNSPVQAADRQRELSVAAYNVENLYDFRDNPNSGCDFPGNPGCTGVNPPFDYVPESDAVYQGRLVSMAQQIILDLHSPDVVLVQETEAQDVCTVSAAWTPASGPGLGADRLDCDLVNTGANNTRTDGRPDSLLELALVIAEQGGPLYDAAFDLDAGDARGITTAYLYRTDRVELLPADPDDPVLGADPQVVYDGTPLAFNSDVQNPKALNAQLPASILATCTGSGPTACDGTNVFSRGPSVALFRVWRAQPGLSSWTDVYLVNNHQSSGPNNRVLQRTEQGTYNARIAEAILAADPQARVVVGGDFNVFPRPDDPFAPGEFIHAAIGVGPSDQLRSLYDSPLENLYEYLVANYPASAFSFGFQGQAQTLDHVWVSPTLLDELVDFRSAKINVDWPADALGEAPAYGRFGASDHDPEAGTFGIISFDRVRALIDLLVAEGLLDSGRAADMHDRLNTAEARAAEGNVAQAQNVLRSIVRQLSAPGGGGLPAGVAGGLRVEIEQLIVLVGS